MFADRFPASPTGEDKLVGVVFTVVGAVGILGGWTLAFVVALAGRYLARQTHYTFCMVVAGLACLCVPPGTVLGVFTIMVLIRPSVKELFDLHAQVESTTS